MDKIYKKTVELSAFDSPTTSSVTCFCGDVLIGNEETVKKIFVEIADCHDKIRLYKYDNDYMTDYISTLRKLGNTILEFADYLEKTETEDK